MYFYPGDLVVTNSCYVWEGDTTVKPGIVRGYLFSGDLACILNPTPHGILVLTSKGVVGWVDGRGLIVK